MDMKLTADFQQITRIDGKGVFVEVMNSMFDKGKVIFNFEDYDDSKPAGQRKKNALPVFVDIDKFLVLSHDFMSGRIAALAKIEKARVAEEQAQVKASGQNRTVYAKHIWQDQGGISAEKLAKQGKSRPDGMSLARQFKLTPGTNKPWILSAEYGPGEENDTGLIVPKYTRPEHIIRVPFENDESMKAMLLIVQAHLQGFISSQYMVQAADGKPVFQRNAS